MSIGVAQEIPKLLEPGKPQVLRGFMFIGVAQELEVISVPAATRLPQAFADGDSVTSKDIDKIMYFFQNADRITPGAGKP